jgi:hypothetical protein
MQCDDYDFTMICKHDTPQIHVVNKFITLNYSAIVIVHIVNIHALTCYLMSTKLARRHGHHQTDVWRRVVMLSTKLARRHGHHQTDVWRGVVMRSTKLARRHGHHQTDEWRGVVMRSH